MKKNQNFEKAAKQLRSLSISIFLFFMALAGILIFVLTDPTLSAFKSKPELKLVSAQDSITHDKNFDKIEDGIHVRTGFIDGEGLMTVVNNCTNCHSAKLVTQNRMTADGWRSTIKWMQDSQNLWDLGKNEELIVNYLATYYAPERKGRRENLTNVEWYKLE